MIQELRTLEELGLVRCFEHKQHPILGWNYTEEVQFKKLWGEHPILRQCRGLSTDHEGRIVGRGFAKFFNWEEHADFELPGVGDKIEVTEKLDGSLIIVFRHNGELVFSTRGSFYSDQALAAKEVFDRLYDPSWIEGGKSYLFEYVGPENRIVVSYSEDDLVHLAVLDHNGVDLPRDERFNLVPVHQFSETFGPELYEFLRSQPDKNREGFVIRQIPDSGPSFRMKVKYDSYCALHRLVTNTSNIDVWDSMRLGEGIERVLPNIPDEFHSWLSRVESKIRDDYSKVKDYSERGYELVKGLPTRKEQAQTLLASEYKEAASIIFLMLDGKSFESGIWKKIKPEVRELPNSR